MKSVVKFFISISLFLMVMLGSVGCLSRDGFQGQYDCSYISVGGVTQNVSNVYEYYYVKLNGSGTATNAFKLKTAPYTEGKGKSKYKIEDGKFIETVDGVSSTYTFDESTFTIIASLNLQGYMATVHFTRK